MRHQSFLWRLDVFFSQWKNNDSFFLNTWSTCISDFKLHAIITINYPWCPIIFKYVSKWHPLFFPVLPLPGKDGHYMYMKASSTGPNSVARLESFFIPTDTTQCLSLWYHMFGSDVDKLSVYVKVRCPVSFLTCIFQKYAKELVYIDIFYSSTRKKRKRFDSNLWQI